MDVEVMLVGDAGDGVLCGERQFGYSVGREVSRRHDWSCALRDGS
jgi:hypothetical protein